MLNKSYFEFFAAKKHPIQIGEEKVKCLKCCFESKYKNHMKNHEQKCGGKNYEIQKCDACEFKISSEFLLAKHERTEHGIYSRLLPGNKIKLKKKPIGK